MSYSKIAADPCQRNGPEHVNWFFNAARGRLAYVATGNRELAG
jgi:hypothetical protein